MEKSIETNKVKGWGSDADFARRPYVPKHKLQEDTGAHWDRPEMQQSDIEVLHSIERPSLTAVYGTTAPPRGLSGVIRRFAFKYSENSFGHWIPLVLADRIDMLEGMIEDVRDGKMPRLLGDGYMVDLKYAPTKFAMRVTRSALLIGAPLALFYMMSKRKRSFA